MNTKSPNQILRDALQAMMDAFSTGNEAPTSMRRNAMQGAEAAMMCSDPELFPSALTAVAQAEPAMAGTIDTPEFLSLVERFAHESSCEEFNEAEYNAARAGLIAHIDAHTSAALAAQMARIHHLEHERDLARAALVQQQTAMAGTDGLPPLPEMESLADLPYAQNTPDDWDADYRATWQKLQVAGHNKMQWRAYALQLRAALTQRAASDAAPVESADMCLLIDALLMSWIGYEGDSPEIRSRRINARSAIESAFAGLRTASDADSLIADLSMLVRRLVRQLEKDSPGTDLAPQALDFLKRKGLQGSPLRTASDAGGAVAGTMHPKQESAYRTLVASLRSQLTEVQKEAARNAEAVNTLASERAANAQLTAELEKAHRAAQPAAEPVAWDWARLKELALAATPGPWVQPNKKVPYVKSLGPESYLLHTMPISPDAKGYHPDTRIRWLNDAAYIAAANPGAILSLLEQLERSTPPEPASAPNPNPNPCSGCGNADPESRCLGCGHIFYGQPVSAPGSDHAKPGCDLCGCVGLHACPGAPMEPWTPEKIAEFHAALAEYESEPDHAKRAEGAAPQLNSLGLAEDWSVTVEASGERVLCISNQHYAGMSDITPYEATIEGCARHLLSFIGARGQQAGDALDGARYRFLREHPIMTDPHNMSLQIAEIAPGGRYVNSVRGEQMDRAIDAAMAASAKGDV